MIRLLLPMDTQKSKNARSIELLGKKWVICEYADVADAPTYTCISYAWGLETVENPFYDGQLMSARTIPVLEAAFSASHSAQNWSENIRFDYKKDAQKEKEGRDAALSATQAIWIDALSVPPQEPTRTACLQSMGQIYSAAHQVLVVLDKQCSKVIQSISKGEKIETAALLSLEKESWVSRAWTYQEAVNSRTLYFIFEEENSAIIAGQDFLKAVGDAIEEFKNLRGYDKISWTQHHASLEGLENLVADYLIFSYAQRSAYHVMSVVCQRTAERPEDQFYAMVGSITTKAPKILNAETLLPSEYFMGVCERKGDFSFIYNTAKRSPVLGQHWRPVDEQFFAVLPGLITFGDGQKGQRHSTHLALTNMHQLVPGAINPDGLKAARWFMGANREDLSPEETASGVLKRMRALGFTGSGDYQEYETGFFFPQTKPSDPGNLTASISCGLNWVTGGPGLLLEENDLDVKGFRDVGAFVGRSPKSGLPINVR